MNQPWTSHEPVTNHFITRLSWCCASLSGVPFVAPGELASCRAAMSIVESELVFWGSTLTLEVLLLGWAGLFANWLMSHAQWWLQIEVNVVISAG